MFDDYCTKSKSKYCTILQFVGFKFDTHHVPNNWGLKKYSSKRCSAYGKSKSNTFVGCHKLEKFMCPKTSGGGRREHDFAEKYPPLPFDQSFGEMFCCNIHIWIFFLEYCGFFDDSLCCFFEQKHGCKYCRKRAFHRCEPWLNWLLNCMFIFLMNLNSFF